MENQKEEKNENIENDKEIKEENNEEKKEEENKQKVLDKKQILQDKLKKIFLEREQNKYKYNKINIPDNLKYSSDNSNSSREIKSNEKINENKNNEENNDNNNDNAEKNTNITKHPTKNYVIKKPPERKKNKETEEDSKNKTFSVSFGNNRKNNLISKKENNININNDENKIEENNDNKDKKDSNQITKVISEDKEKEKEAEKNKFSYRQLIAEKCHDIIKLEKEKKEFVNNIKLIKDNNEQEKEIDKESIITQNKIIENEDRKRSKTINNKNKEFSSTKEGTLKILQLIKAKKNEKNLIEKKLKETQNNIKEDKIEPNEKNNKENNINIIDNNKDVDILNNNNDILNNINNDNNININTPKKKIAFDNKVESPKENLKQSLEIHNEEKIEDNNTKTIENKEEEKEIKDNNININNRNSLTTKIQIYKKFKGKGKSYLMGSGNNTNQTIKCKLEKESVKRNIDNIISQKPEKPKIIIRNKINRHNTSINVTKKNYILKPKELNLNQEDNDINNKISIDNNDKIKPFQSQQNLNNFRQKPKNNNLYEPKKGIIFNNKNQYDERSLDLNIENKSPRKLYGEKMTYVKKSFINNSSNKKSTGHKLNNSIGNIGPFINNNFSLEKISNNKMNPPIEYIKYKNNNTNLNSSFKLANELGKTYYNIGNIFNIDNLDDDNNINLSNNFNINFNLDSLYNINYPFNKSKVKNNMFYSNNFFPQSDNNNWNSNSNKKIRINNVYNQYKNNNISNIKKGRDKIYNSINVEKNYNNKNNLYNSLKYEDLLILDDKLINIEESLNKEKIIANDCFEFWNYFYNNSLYENLNIFYSNYDNEYRNMFKMSINYILLSIILSYDISFEAKKLDKIRPLLLEMLQFSNKLLINIYEYILNIIPYTKSNIWINKISKLIQQTKSLDESDSFFVESEKNIEKEKLNLNINFLSKKIYYILTNYPTKITQRYLSSFFKKINEKSLEEIYSFFLINIFREKEVKYSILGFNFLRSGETMPNPPTPPFLKFRQSKKYFLICDIDETLFHFKITEEDSEQGVLKIRPGVFQFIEEIRKYYEIILFSEADKEYVDLILEPIVSKRYLYDYILCRDYISIEENNFIKDLNKIGTPLDKTVIMDNMPQNFRKNKENAVYIKSFFGEENDDKALIDLIPVLVNIAKSGKDVRKELIKYKENIVCKISSNLYKHIK